MTEEHAMQILEENRRFSKSMLWTLQRRAYAQFGIEAWVDKGVPSYLTSNPYTVRQYAKVVAGFLRDCLRNKMIDRTAPIYIFDLGAGSGRFGYLFLKNFLHIIHHLYGKIFKICYVMTDIVEGNLDFLMNHRSFQPYIKAGVVDFALYSHDQEAPLVLKCSGKHLSKLQNPAAIIGNYFFDTIPQDFFRIRSGKLEEGRVSLLVGGDSPVSDDPKLIQELQARYAYVPILNPGSYYSEESQFNALLLNYLKEFDALNFLFPCGALQVIRYFRELSKDRLLILAGDQGVVTEEQMVKVSEPHIDKHGTFSISVCYHAIAAYIRLQGGVPLLTTFSDPLFAVMAAVFGGGRREFRETTLAFEQSLDSFEPKDYWNLVSIEEQRLKELPLDSLVLLLKLGCWDPVNFTVFFDPIRQKLSQASTEEQEHFFPVIMRVYENFYPISKEEGNFVINLGVLCFDIGRYDKALELFQEAHRIMGDTPLVFRNISACHAKLSNPQAAFAFLNKAIKLEK